MDLLSQNNYTGETWKTTSSQRSPRTQITPDTPTPMTRYSNSVEERVMVVCFFTFHGTKINTIYVNISSRDRTRRSITTTIDGQCELVM